MTTDSRPKLRPASPIITGEHPTLTEIPVVVPAGGEMGDDKLFTDRIAELEKEVEELEEDVALLRSGQDHAVQKAAEYERARLRAIIDNEPEYPADWDPTTLARYKALVVGGHADAQLFARIAVAETKRSLLEKLQ